MECFIFSILKHANCHVYMWRQIKLNWFCTSVQWPAPIKPIKSILLLLFLECYCWSGWNTDHFPQRRIKYLWFWFLYGGVGRECTECFFIPVVHFNFCWGVGWSRGGQKGYLTVTLSVTAAAGEWSQCWSESADTCRPSFYFFSAPDDINLIFAFFFLLPHFCIIPKLDRKFIWGQERASIHF